MDSCGTPCAHARKPWDEYVRDHIQEHGANSKGRGAFGDRGRSEFSQRYGLCAPAEPLVNCKFLVGRFAGTRIMLLPKLLSKMGYKGDSVEVGVYKGAHSQLLLKKWGTGGTHTLVDPYVHSSLGCKKLMDKQCRMNQTKFDQLHNLTRAAFARSFPRRARMLRQYSVEASRTFENASLSFIYIDARHDYDGVLEDLHAWWPKLCPGGMLAGHDWTQEGRQGYSKIAKKNLPVAAAVHRFLLERDLHDQSHAVRDPMDLFITSEHPASWLMFKPAMPCPR